MKNTPVTNGRSDARITGRIQTCILHVELSESLRLTAHRKGTCLVMTRIKLSQIGTLVLISLILITGFAMIPLAPSETAQAAIGDQKRIVYLDRNNNVWIARTSGEEAEQLTSGGGYGNVQLSADGTRVIATGPYGEGTGIFLLAADQAFSPRSIAAGRTPAWSPDGSRFAFADGDNVHVFDRNGNFLQTAQAQASALKWSPNGQTIGFGRTVVDPYGSGCPVQQLGWINANNGNTATGGATVGDFTWSGDGNAILHVSANDGTIRALSTSSGQSELVSNLLINPCGAPMFTTADGVHLIGTRWADGAGTDIVAINQQTGEESVFSNMPVSFPASRLPSAYVSGDHTGRYLNLARSFPTDVHRLDLQTGQLYPVIAGDYRRLVNFSADGQFAALLASPPGNAQEITLTHLGGNWGRTITDVGWIAWETSRLNASAALSWQQNWDREDRPVAAGVSRTWLWGPEPFDVRVEPYVDAPDGYRAVRYYDKSRMEITNPAGDRTSDWYVTNGLLVRELITGELQAGDDQFFQLEPAQIPVAGDDNDPDGPTYATMLGLLDAPAAEPGSEITATLNRAGEVGDGGPGGVTAAHYVDVTDHTIANVFWDYLNSSGTIWDGQQFVDGRLFEPTFFATGFPITEAYWSTVRVAGVERDVLIQCFERRCLTYTPDNPEGWRVEMGNVGRHYHAWRYQ
jgi:hypothetical protein